MSISIEAYLPEHIDAVTSFNRRLTEGGVSYQFPENPVPAWLPKGDGGPIYQEYFLALDSGRRVRGAYVLKHQTFLVRGREITIGNYQLPLSEGIIDRRFNAVGLQLLSHARSRNRLLYCLGMGGKHQPLPKLLQALDWHLQEVPFFFYVARAESFLRNITYLRERTAIRLLCNMAALSGLGQLCFRLLHWWRGKPVAVGSRESCRILTEFDSQTNELWPPDTAAYSLIGDRSLPVLNALYPPSDNRFIRLQITNDQERTIGWAVLLDTAMHNHKQFGSMRVGSIVDCLARPEAAGEVIAQAKEHLLTLGVDMIVSNQSHPSWKEALLKAGFINGPSNFVLATSPDLTRLVAETDPSLSNLHFNRGDGDGPINL